LDKSRKTSSQHAGLGLAIAKRILELHKGCIWASSPADNGATFGFQIDTRAFVTEM
jgi:signal transduction histidine kinase